MYSIESTLLTVNLDGGGGGTLRWQNSWGLIESIHRGSTELLISVESTMQLPITLRRRHADRGKAVRKFSDWSI
jgi:hypothetical protein